MQPAIEYREHDRIIWEEDLADFVPQRVFDAHCHLVDLDHVPADKRPAGGLMFDRSTDFARLDAASKMLYSGRDLGYLTLGMPLPGIDVAKHAAFHAAETRGRRNVVANRLVTPACTPEEIRRDVKAHGFVGLKPYRLYSVTGDAAQCRIHEFLTHEQMEVASELGLFVTMHLSRHHGCADEHNLADLREYTTKRYPGIRWILAHCARSFTYWPLPKAIDQLRDMPNIYYDTSAVTDVRPIATLLKGEKLERIMYGSDLVDAVGFHGLYGTFGRAWFQVETDRMPQLRFPHTDGRPILVAYEHLLCLKSAVEYAGLSRSDVEAIFWGNAAKLFSLTQ